MTDKWIEDAFRSAMENHDAAQYGGVIGDFLADNSPAILDIWRDTVGTEKALPIIRFIAESGDEVADTISEMTKIFCVAGFMLAEHLFNKQ